MIRKNQEVSGTESAATAGKPFGKKFRSLFIIVASILTCCVLALGVVMMSSCRSSGGKTYSNLYKTTTRAGYSAEYLGTVERKIPTEMKDGGLSAYPVYGKSLSSVLGDANAAARTALIREANSLNSKQTRNGAGFYEMMDAEGNLYMAGNGDGNPGEPVSDAILEYIGSKKLYKHSASEGMYLGNVANDEPAIVKKVTWLPRGYDGYGVTGVYAPAGEVIKIQISEEDMNATGGITVHIGQALYNAKANNIWVGKNQMQRMPVILNTMDVTKNTSSFDEATKTYTAYVGSFLGGPIYVRNESVAFSVTISGGVRYSHFILGYTTPEEFAENAKSSAPYFDLEVWENGVLHSGPANYAKGFSYDDLYKAAVYWDKVSLVSTKRNKQGIVFLYDPFVAAGAAVAFPGQRSVNCPSGWMSSSLNYNALVTSGAWGNMHEFNHNFQGYGCGVGADGEVTNNALTLVEYSLFTKISAARQIGAYGGAGLSGWNCYTSAPWVINRVDTGNITSTSGLAVYATLLHNFGQDAFMEAATARGEAWFKKWGDITKRNMSYYAEITNAYSNTAGYLDNLREEQKDYPMFVPAASVYQTGMRYTAGDREVEFDTMQPYQIEYGKAFTVDLNKYETDGFTPSGSIVVPEGFDVKVKNVTKPAHGKLEKTADNVYTYTPDSSLRSGKFTVTIELVPTKDEYKGFKLEDIDLVLELEQTHEMNKNMLERTTYTYAAGSVPASAVAAFESDYKGYVSKVDGDNLNKTQNCNTDIWYTNKDGDDVPENSVVELRGKLYVDEDGKYRIALRGRWNVALFVSLDEGKTYELVGSSEGKTTGNDFMTKGSFNQNCPYKDYELKGDTWLYFKAVMVAGKDPKGGSSASYIGLGWGKFTPPLGILDEDGNIIGETPESVSVAYATAYRNSYEFSKGGFESEYFYTRDYGWSYIDENECSTFDKSEEYEVKLLNTLPAGNKWSSNAEDPASALFDGKSDTIYHSNNGVSEKSPAVVNIDMGRTITSNTLTVFSRSKQPGAPKKFTLSVSDDGTNYREVGSYGDGINAGDTSVTVSFETTSFRYFTLVITDTTHGSKYLIVSEIRFTYPRSIKGGKVLAPDSETITYKGDWGTESALSTYGHVYTGKKNATAQFEFTGKRFGILLPAGASAEFEVKIDGKKVSSIDLVQGTGYATAAYISSELSEGTHKVEIKCKGKGTAKIDSFVIWN